SGMRPAAPRRSISARSRSACAFACMRAGISSDRISSKSWGMRDAGWCCVAAEVQRIGRIIKGGDSGAPRLLPGETALGMVGGSNGDEDMKRMWIGAALALGLAAGAGAQARDGKPAEKEHWVFAGVKGGAIGWEDAQTSRDA